MAHNPKIMAGIAKQVFKLSEEDSEGKRPPPIGSAEQGSRLILPLP